jgi:hypothetical protein
MNERENEKDDDSERHEQKERYASGTENPSGRAHEAGSKTLAL